VADADQEALRQVFYNKNSPGNLPTELMQPLFPTSVLMQLGPLKAEIGRLEATHPGAPQRAMALVDSPQPKNSHIFIRGNSSRLGEEVPRQFLAILAGDKREPFTHGSGRLELAKAIASRENPLTARVMVNRLWLHHFGAGLVTTPDDYGLRSDPPSHPELLDYLAWQFMQDGWSLKKMHRLMMLSSVYQQQSDDNLRYEKMDPDNRLLAKANRRRLDFESMRDTLLFVVGKLDRTLGGRPIALQNQPQMNSKGNFGSGTGNQGAYSNRRTVYGVIDRNDLLPLFRNFDFANPDISTAQRDVTTVPQQALFFLNNPFVMQQACSLAARADFQLFDETAKRVQYVYQQVLQRDPTAGEIELAIQFLSAGESAASLPAEDFATDSRPRGGFRPLRPWERFVHVLLMSDELMFID
jgi:hypothetical protein